MNPRTRLLLAVPLLAVASLASAQAMPTGPFARAFAERLVERRAAFASELVLDPAQQAAFDALGRSQLLAAMEARADIEALVIRIKNDLAAPAADLRATAAEIDATVDRRIAAQRDLREARLAFYDQLDPAQQEKARAELLDRIERLERLRVALLDLAALAY
jgi:Spy/CpxP family protein refolding chaperone